MKAEIQYAPRDLNEVIYPNVAVERRIKGYAAGGLEGHVISQGYSFVPNERLVTCDLQQATLLIRNPCNSSQLANIYP